MAKQSNDFTWNSISNELKELIKQRLGEPMAKDIASTKGGSCDLDFAIGHSLLYDPRLMGDRADYLPLVHRLFPEIWPAEVIIKENSVEKVYKFDIIFRGTPLVRRFVLYLTLVEVTKFADENVRKGENYIIEQLPI